MNKKAVALVYNSIQQSSPKVIAKGRDHIAIEIIKKAKEHNISIFENEILADSLLNVEIDDEIPPRLYRAVAEVFVWLNRAQEKGQTSKS